MNKSEAYKLLIKELEKVRTKGLVEANAMVSKTPEYIVNNGNGKAYSITLKLSDNELHGSISELNSFKFELLEEKVGID